MKKMAFIILLILTLFLLTISCDNREIYDPSQGRCPQVGDYYQYNGNFVYAVRDNEKEQSCYFRTISRNGNDIQLREFKNVNGQILLTRKTQYLAVSAEHMDINSWRIDPKRKLEDKLKIDTSYYYEFSEKTKQYEAVYSREFDTTADEYSLKYLGEDSEGNKFEVNLNDKNATIFLNNNFSLNHPINNIKRSQHIAEAIKIFDHYDQRTKKNFYTQIDNNFGHSVLDFEEKLNIDIDYDIIYKNNLRKK